LKIKIGNEFYPVTYIDKMNEFLEFNYGEDSRKFRTEAEGLQFISDTSLLQSCEVVKIQISNVV
jgi:hypothetical protein